MPVLRPFLFLLILPYVSCARSLRPPEVKGAIAPGATHSLAVATHNASSQVDSASNSTAAHNANATANATAGSNASSNATANATGVFKPSCAKACDSCFATHAMTCYAVCYEGLQAYCKTKCSSSYSCNPKWSAVPGSGANGIDKKFCDGTVDADGCPTQNYNR